MAADKIHYPFISHAVMLMPTNSSFCQEGDSSTALHLDDHKSAPRHDREQLTAVAEPSPSWPHLPSCHTAGCELAGFP